MSATVNSTDDAQFVGSSVNLETGDEIITNYDGPLRHVGDGCRGAPRDGC